MNIYTHDDTDIEGRLKRYMDDHENFELIMQFIRQKLKNAGSANWCDVASEGVEAYNLMFMSNAEPESPIDDFVCAVAAVTEEVVISRVAQLIGCDQQALETALDTVELVGPDRQKQEIDSFRRDLKERL